MKRLPLVILVVMSVLVAMVTGCCRATRYDGRLVAADSLMRSDPDSALAVVEGVCRDSLAADGDCAYRDLLLTQARYRCYVTATSDSIINRALAYYRAHPGEREKLTRAYIYKGAVMEELDHPDSAMFYYKHAEVTADTTDYFNLGYIYTRIADLYRLYYADQEICFKKYETALEYHKKSGNKQMQQNCYFNMAGCLGITRRDNPDVFLKKALDLAYELRDTFLIVESLELYLRQLSINDSTRQQAKRIALDCIDKYPGYVSIDLLLDLAYLHACDGENNSANGYLDIVDNAHMTDNAGQVQSRSNSIHAIIARNEGNPARAESYTRLSHQLEDSLTDNKYRYFIQHLENTENEVRTNNTNHKISTLKVTLNVIASLFATAVSLLLITNIRRRNHIKSIMHELEAAKVNKHESLLGRIDEKDSVIEKLVENMVVFMQTSIETVEKDSPAVIRKRIKETIVDVADEDFWKELGRYLDKYHNNIISNIRQDHPKMTDKDLRFIELSCCGFSYIEMAIILDYTPKYISQKRKELAKKMNLSMPLQDYLDNQMK